MANQPLSRRGESGRVEVEPAVRAMNKAHSLGADGVILSWYAETGGGYLALPFTPNNQRLVDAPHFRSQVEEGLTDPTWIRAEGVFEFHLLFGPQPKEVPLYGQNMGDSGGGRSDGGEGPEGSDPVE
jgi:hypothetical protein